MIIARCNIRNERSKHIKWCSLTDCLLNLHIRFDLIKRHMTRSLDHNLNILFPGTSCQLTECDQLLNLGNIGCILQTARTTCITKAHRNIIFSADIQHFIIILVEWILITGHLHPCINDGTATGYDVHQTFILTEMTCCFLIDATVDRHEINAILRMHSDNVEPLLRGDLL